MICADCYDFLPQDEGIPHRLALHALGSLRKLQRAESFGIVHIGWAGVRGGRLGEPTKKTQNAKPGDMFAMIAVLLLPPSESLRMKVRRLSR
jgi:hypothetical protein